MVTEASTAPCVNRRLASISIVAFWLLYFVLNSLRMTIERGGPQWELMARRTIVTTIGIVLTSLFCLLLRRLEGKSVRVLVAVVFVGAIPVSTGYALANYTVFYAINHADAEKMKAVWHGSPFAEPIYVLSDSAVSWYFFIVAWGILYVALSYAARVRHAERRAALFEMQAQSAQLRALRYQINPHFLFNTLNSLSTLILARRAEEAERMVMTLATFFRSSLTADPTEDVPLADEIRMQRLYLDIEQTRFPERLRVEIDLPPPLEGAMVPALLLQPLVENAIKHGVARTARPVTVSIKARRTGPLETGRLVITVEDDAAPVTPSANGYGVGLRNVCERLAARFEQKASCAYGPRPGGGYRAELRLPLQMPAAS